MICTAIASCALIAAISAPARAGAEAVRYAKAPEWVVAVPSSTGTPPPPGASIRFDHIDYQIHLGPDGDEIFNAWRMRILTSDALAAGNVTLTWSPDGGDATIHYLRILRGGQTIDVLESTKFQVVRREGDLESAVLNGLLTAALQVPGLQVGDDLEFAATVRRKDPTLGDHSFGFAQLPPGGMSGAFRVRLLWPEARQVKWQASPDVPRLKETLGGGRKELIYDLRDPRAVITAVGAPARANIRRVVEYSDFTSWRAVSAHVWPLYAKASALARESPIRGEIARIAASTPDHVRRAEAALQLVQEQLRYVYVGTDGGNLRPASIDDTWTRRFGDCKAKTAMLMALLTGLGIQAEPVLVSSLGGDGINERLPSPGLFDHVLVRATVGSTVHWLDGTRAGDKSLAALPPTVYRWVLPLRADGTDLEAVAPVIPRVPQTINVVEMDASGGFDRRASVTAHLILRGDEAYTMRRQLSAMSADDAERAIREFWGRSDNWLEADSASWRYDEQGSVLKLSVVGTAKLEWTGDDDSGRVLTLIGAGFSPPPEYRRPKEQDQAAPWATEYPKYRCWATSIRLPAPTSKWKWDYRANPMQLKMGDETFWRTSDMRDGVVRTVMSRRIDVPELSAAEAQEVNRQVPTFDNKMSKVYQIAADKTPASHVALAAPPFAATTDWMDPTTPCSAPAGQGK
jgi:Domain of Unknown Function with PDB structure (DUF3857)